MATPCANLSSDNYLTLYMLIFSEGTKHISTFHVIPPYWHDTGNWNHSSWKTRTCLIHIANIMAADDLVTQRARASTAMILTYLNWDNSVPRFERSVCEKKYVIAEKKFWSNSRVKQMKIAWRTKENLQKFILIRLNTVVVFSGLIL